MGRDAVLAPTDELIASRGRPQSGKEPIQHVIGTSIELVGGRVVVNGRIRKDVGPVQPAGHGPIQTSHDGRVAVVRGQFIENRAQGPRRWRRNW